MIDRNTWIGLTAAALCVVFALAAPSGGGEIDTLKKSTLAIHDEAMKTMADMNRIGRMLKREMTTLDTLAPRRAVIRQVLGRMKQAEEGMYAWMQQYTPPDDMKPEVAKPYLEDQKRKIEQNRRDIQEALEAGHSLLKQ